MMMFAMLYIIQYGIFEKVIFGWLQLWAILCFDVWWTHFLGFVIKTFFDAFLIGEYKVV